MFHRHRWVVVSAKEVNNDGGLVVAMVGMQRPITYVLWQCLGCTKFLSESFIGPFAVDINELVARAR